MRGLESKARGGGSPLYPASGRELQNGSLGARRRQCVVGVVDVGGRCRVRGGVVELVDLEDELPVLRAVNEMQPISEDFSLDKSGIFKSVEPKIYSNGRCFEVRRLVIGQGVVKSYYRSLLLARGSLLDSTTEKGKED